MPARVWRRRNPCTRRREKSAEAVRQVSEIDRAALEKDGFSFNVHLLLGGQIRGEDAAVVPDLSAGKSAQRH